MKMLRKRFIPNEVVDISKDEVLLRRDDLIVTKWLPIKPREDIGSGMSYTYFKEGFKLSKMYKPSGEPAWLYCDIIDYDYNEQDDTFTFIDLLVDVKIYPDGKVELLDFDELEDAYSQGLIDGKLLLKAINNLNKLLTIIENKEIDEYLINVEK